MSTGAASQRISISTSLDDEHNEVERKSEIARLSTIEQEVKSEYSSGLPKKERVRLQNKGARARARLRVIRKESIQDAFMLQNSQLRRVVHFIEKRRSLPLTDFGSSTAVVHALRARADAAVKKAIAEQRNVSRQVGVVRRAGPNLVQSSVPMSGIPNGLSMGVAPQWPGIRGVPSAVQTSAAAAAAAVAAAAVRNRQATTALQPSAKKARTEGSAGAGNAFGMATAGSHMMGMSTPHVSATAAAAAAAAAAAKAAADSAAAVQQAVGGGGGMGVSAGLSSRPTAGGGGRSNDATTSAGTESRSRSFPSHAATAVASGIVSPASVSASGGIRGGGVAKTNGAAGGLAPG